MKFISMLWTWPAHRPFIIRLLVKCVVFAFLFLLVTFPNPLLNIKQISAYMNTEALFNPDFPELESINASIDSLLPQDFTFEQEYQTIIRFIYKNIPYQFDWDNWGNSEYWPSAVETWRRGREDCDGRAILAVAIFRSRGYADANIVGSMKHLWIKVGDQELMGPDTEKIMVVEDGQKKMRMPSFMYLLEALAMQFYYYPIFRMVIILLTFLILIYHPAKSIKLLLALSLLAIIGFVLILDWATYVSFYDEMTIKANLVIGTLFVLISLILAFFAKRFVASS